MEPLRALFLKAHKRNPDSLMKSAEKIPDYLT